mmetsp:Transcript_5023/g.14230  ORF Transcript_5023/g.14230 Transcript_5023/m.14230 type:complete len:275 (-) Transcript_5023:7-831(-)
MLDPAILNNGRVRIARQALAVAATVREGGARAGDVHRRATPIQVGADAVLALARARHVWLRGLIAHATAGGVRQRLEPDVRRRDPASVAGAQGIGNAVEEMLHGEVDVDAVASARDLDAVRERGQRAVGPARAAVLRYMLVPAHGAVAALPRDALEVAPVPGRVADKGQVLDRGLLAAVHLRAARRRDDLALPPRVLRHRGEAHDLAALLQRGHRRGPAPPLDEAHLLRRAASGLASQRARRRGQSEEGNERGGHGATQVFRLKPLENAGGATA